MSNTPRIAVVGSCATDLTTFTEVFPRAGETVFGQRFNIGFGGKGANQAVAARLCGAQVAMIGCVGRDLFGDAIVKNFEGYGVDVSHLRRAPDVSSGVAPIFVDPSGQNRIIVVKGANELVTPASVDAAADVLAHVDTIILQFEVPLETVYHTVAFAKRRGIRCLVNPAPAVPVQLSQLTEADYFIPNETEAELITGRSVQTPADAREAAAQLLARGFRKVILTLGERGSLIASAEGATPVAPFSVKPVDTTGAGDAFIGSFAVFLGEGLPEAQAASRANLYAGLSTTRVGTQQSFLTRADFERAWAEATGAR